MDWAAREDGALTTAELHACGFDKDSIALWVRHRKMRRKHHGVYVLGSVDGVRTDARAALKAGGPNATAGFHLAAQLDGFGPPAQRPFDVIVPPSHRGKREGLELHRIELDEREVIRLEGLRTTVAELTCLHLARVMTPDDYELVLQEAFAKGRTDARRLERALGRHRGERGTRLVSTLLELGVDELRSKAEREMRRIVCSAQLGPVAFNERVGRWKVDLLFPAHRLVVEINGFGAHSSPWAAKRDHRKQQQLEDAGFAYRRYTALQVLTEPEYVLAHVVRAMSQSLAA